MTNDELKSKYESLIADIDNLSESWDTSEGKKLEKIFHNYWEVLPKQDNPFQFSDFEVDVDFAKTEPKLKSHRNLYAKKYFSAKKRLKEFIETSISEIPGDDEAKSDQTFFEHSHRSQ